MEVSLQGFRDLAAVAKADRDIVINHKLNAIRTKFFHSASSNVKSAQINRSTMIAFRTMLRGAYGDFGEDAFNQLLGTRKDRGQSLRAGDVLSAIRLAESGYRSTSEALLQSGRASMDLAFANDPVLRQVPAELRDSLKEAAFRKLSQDPAFTSFEDFDFLLEKIKEDANVLSRMVTKLLLEEVKQHPALAPDRVPADGGAPLVVRRDKTWTESDTRALMLNPKDPNAQAMLDRAFSDFINAHRGNPDPFIKAMIAEWDDAHDGDNWAFENDFFTFGRKYASQLPMGIAFAAEKILEGAFAKDKHPLTQVAKERLALLFTPKASEATSELSRKLVSLQKTQIQAEAKAIMLQMHGLSTEAIRTTSNDFELIHPKTVDLTNDLEAKEVELARFLKANPVGSDDAQLLNTKVEILTNLLNNKVAELADHLKAQAMGAEDPKANVDPAKIDTLKTEVEVLKNELHAAQAELEKAVKVDTLKGEITALKTELNASQKLLNDADKAYDLARDLRNEADGINELVKTLLRKFEDGSATLAETLTTLEGRRALGEAAMPKLAPIKTLLRPFEPLHPESMLKDFRTLTIAAGKSACEAQLAKAKALEAEALVIKATLEDARNAISKANDLPHKDDLLAMVDALLESKLPIALKAFSDATDLQEKIEAFDKRLEALSEDKELSNEALANEIAKSKKDLNDACTELQNAVRDAKPSLEGILENVKATSALKNICFAELSQAITESEDFPRFA